MSSERYLLKSKNTPLAVFSVEKSTTTLQGKALVGYAVHVEKIFEENRYLLPVVLRERVHDQDMERWLRQRLSPTGKRILEEIAAAQKRAREEADNPLFHARWTKLLSLNDTFWVDAEDSADTWEEVNLFENTFSKDIGDLVFSASLERILSFRERSPEFTSKGMMKKCWVRRKDGLFLLKSDTFMASPDGRSQVAMEWFAQQVAEVMGIPHVPYTIEDYVHADGERELVCACPIFTSPETGFVEASQLGAPSLEDLRSARGQLLLAQQYATDAYADMMIFDVLVGNHDRHLNNYGFLFATDSGDMLDFAPLFDNGFALTVGSRIPRHFSLEAWRREHGAAFLSFERQAQLFLAERHRSALEKIRHMELEPHPLLPIREEICRFLQGFVHAQAEMVLQMNDTEG